MGFRNFRISVISEKIILPFIKRSYFGFLILLLLFIIIRSLIISSFPIFNDESLYIQYSQIINSDFNKYKYISIDNIFHDWKPPLQYWLGSLVIDKYINPILTTRLLSVSFSIVGFIAFYLFIFNLYGKREALLASFLFVIFSQAALYNTIFVAETYVFSTASLLYFFVLRFIQSPIYKFRIWSAIGAIISGVSLLLFKQSGLLYIYLLPFIPFVNFTVDNLKNREGRRWWQINFLSIISIIIISFWLYIAFIPADSLSIRDKFASRWTIPFGEILNFPIDKWISNIKLIYDFYLHYYTLAVLPLIAGFLIYSFIKRDSRDVVLSLLFIFSSAAIIFGLSGFNEYMYNSAVMIFLLAIIARFAFLTADFNYKNISILKIVTILLILFIIGTWSYQTILMKINPIKYFENGSQWTVGNYVNGWSSGYGIKQVIDFLISQKESALVFADPQWGNPRTSLEVFRNYYPNVKIIPIYADFFQLGFKEKIIKENNGINKFVIFSSAPRDWQPYIYKNFCSKKQEFKEVDNQYSIIVCEF